MTDDGGMTGPDDRWHISEEARPLVRRWVMSGAVLVVVGYLASITTRLLDNNTYAIGTEFVALAIGIVGLLLVLRGYIRAAGVLVLAVVWLEVHASILLTEPTGTGTFSALPVFPLLVVATGLFLGGGYAIGLALVSAVSVPAAFALAGRIFGTPDPLAVFPVHYAVVLDVTMVGSAVLVWQGIRSFQTIERAREAEERKYAQLVRHSPYGIALLDRAGRVLTLNPAAEAMLHVTEAEVRGRLFPEVVAELTDQPHTIATVLDAEESIQTELAFERGGTRRVVEVSGSRAPTSGGATGVQVVLRDVSVRREAEREAIALGRMLDRALSEVYVFDPESLRLRFVNLGARRNLGYDGDTLLGLTITDVAPSLTRTAVRRFTTDLSAAPEEAVAIQDFHRRKDGSHYPVETRLHLVTFGDDAAVGLFALDVSQRVAAEAAQARLQTQMQQAQRFDAIRQLAGGIAHEFNNLLMSIGGYAEMVGEFAADERVQGWAGRIRVAQQRGAALVRRLQGLARTDVAQPEVLALGDTLREFLPVLERTLGPSVHLSLSVEGHDVVTMDRSQLEQVVLHLTANARDAMPVGGAVDLCVLGPPDGGGGAEVVLEIRDRGAGMDEETLRRAFDPFFTGPGRGEGTGLSLTTVRSIVTQAGGQVELESVVDQGTVARVRLPGTDATVPHRRTTPEPVVLGDDAREGGAGILLVEDDQDARAVMVHALTRAGYEVRAVETAEDGLSWMTDRRGEVDLVLTDIALPGMDGFALGAALQEQFAPLRVLYMSGYLHEHAEGAPAGFDPARDLLVKPFSADRLVEAVRAALRQRVPRRSGPTRLAES